MYCRVVLLKLTEDMLKERGAEVQTGQNNLVFKPGESPGYFFVARNEVSAHLFVTPVSHVYAHYSETLKSLLRKSSVVEKVKFSPTSVFVG